MIDELIIKYYENFYLTLPQLKLSRIKKGKIHEGAIGCFLVYGGVSLGNLYPPAATKGGLDEFLRLP